MIVRSPTLDVLDRSVVLAVRLVRAGARMVVVGGTARRLRGCHAAPRDLDVVVNDASVSLLVTALARVGVDVSAAALHRCRVVALTSAWGPCDVFVRDVLPPAGPVTVDGCVLAVTGV